ncbi:MAG: hypothetical protein ACLTBX_04910 [Clostridia bacterium]
MMNFGGISLGIKSKMIFNNIDFKFKKLKFRNIFFGVIILKLDETYYSCFISLDQLKNKICLENLIKNDYFNLIVFNPSNENKIYRIINNLRNKILFTLPNQTYEPTGSNINSYELNKMFSAKMLWNY